MKTSPHLNATEALESLSKLFGEYCLEHQWVAATAESCTAGLIGATVAQTPGSSAWLDRGFIVYTPEAKVEMLGVNIKTIEHYNITSVEVAREMGLGALQHSKANITLAVTGVAGPGGGSADIPVGTICMAWVLCKSRNIEPRVFVEKRVFVGTRNEIRDQVVRHMLLTALEHMK